MQQNIEKSLRQMEAGSYQTLDRRSRRGKKVDRIDKWSAMENW